MTFHDLNLPRAILKSLKYMKFNEPTPVQARSIPLAAQGDDLLVSAQTGTGKTAAFAIPMIAQLMDNQCTNALIMAPTRELAMQVHQTVRQLLGPKNRQKTSLGTALLIGGDSMSKQIGQLKQRPSIIVGTPGRINDHLQRGTWRGGLVDYVVLDEADRMLDMGFGPQIDAVLAHVAEHRQTLMFSATLSKEIEKLAQKYLHNPKRISIAPQKVSADNIKHEIIHTPEQKKYDTLFAELDKREGSILVFVKTRRGAEKLAAVLRKKNYSASAIHGNLSQSQRARAIQGFHKRRFRIMVATDIAARGLDIPHIEHVINVSLPQVAEDYIHRIGRTARAGAAGSALCMLSPEETPMWRTIHKLMYPGHPLPEGMQKSGRRPTKGRKRRYKKKWPEEKSKSQNRNGASPQETNQKDHKPFGQRKRSNTQNAPDHKKNTGSKPDQQIQSGLQQSASEQKIRKRKPRKKAA